MPTHNTIITLPSGPSNPRSHRRRRPPSPAKPPPKPEDAPILSVTRHYPIPTIHPAIHPSSSQTPTIGTHTSPFPPSLPSLRSDTAIETTHFSQDDLTEEVWGPRVTLEPLQKKTKPKSKAKEKEGDMKRYLKMCPTNGYQPRKGEGDGERGMVKCEVSGSTEFVTSYQVERLVGGGRRRTWVTWSRVVVRREEGAEGGGGGESEEEGSSEDGSGDDEEGGSREGSEKTGEEEEEKGKGAKKGKMVKKEKMGKKGKKIEESSDEEYFDDKRCEWRHKEELKMKKGKDVVEEGKKKEKR